jgi:hypothetical protein
MEISIPQQVEDQLDEGERVVGYMTNLFQQTLVFTKKGCSTEEGCSNFIYHEGHSYEKMPVKRMRASLFTPHEILFIRSFLWN